MLDGLVHYELSVCLFVSTVHYGKRVASSKKRQGNFDNLLHYTQRVC